jgi:hypothetical protein
MLYQCTHDRVASSTSSIVLHGPGLARKYAQSCRDRSPFQLGRYRTNHQRTQSKAQLTLLCSAMPEIPFM